VKSVHDGRTSVVRFTRAEALAPVRKVMAEAVTSVVKGVNIMYPMTQRNVRWYRSSKKDALSKVGTEVNWGLKNADHSREEGKTGDI
jgi:hypothetical protein